MELSRRNLLRAFGCGAAAIVTAPLLLKEVAELAPEANDVFTIGQISEEALEGSALFSQPTIMSFLLMQSFQDVQALHYAEIAPSDEAFCNSVLPAMEWSGKLPIGSTLKLDTSLYALE